MTDKPEFTRNDQTAVAFLKKIMDRLDTERQAYEDRVQQAVLTLNSFSAPYGLTYQNAAIAAQYGNHSHRVSTPGHSHSIGISVPQWEPYLTLAEYDTLRAWANGEDILVHILSTER
ncbi:hypothetical protein AS026_19425 [Rhizobium altiplani]|uniref:Uncharacterized protein n=1 Tax=Rhizobium altiplani TaxID=1864509 RepID=A0A109J7M0_9HYPH|nr:hypothetical protein [Rhizobium altiplani]KWV43843.1 hypothetical protein AS026_19425 [Rhizobium altiplani]